MTAHGDQEGGGLVGVHVGGCNVFCDGDEHYLLPSWETRAEHALLTAEANRRTARARLAVIEALATIRADR